MLWWGGIKRKEKAGEDALPSGRADPMGSTPVTGVIEVGKFATLGVRIQGVPAVQHQPPQCACTSRRQSSSDRPELGTTP